MDPFTAVSLAGNILQFLASARSVYKQVAEIRSSVTGLSQKNDAMLSSATELHDMAESITAGLQSFQGTMTGTEKSIRDIGQRCQQLSLELQEDIKNKAAKDRSSVLRATTSVIASSWKIPAAEKKLKELNELQKSLFKQLLIHISRKQTSLGMAMTSLMDQNRKLEMSRAEELAKLKSEIIAASDSLQPLLAKSSSERDTREMGEKLLYWVEQAADIKREQAIIQSLRFDGMLHRREEIPTAHTNTFQWAFAPHLHFQEWLERDDGVYWVSGDPGSGKSTLMKHLSSHRTTQEALRKWAGDKELVMARFFFWFSGTALQKSQEGLLRSLLFEILRQCPSSIAAACPLRWESSASYPWERDELMSTFQRLRLQLPSTRFCFFIDGLDEYRGETEADHGNHVPGHVAEIIGIMDVLSSLPDVKLCISSRPWRAFENAFGGLANRKLYVNEENSGDIRLYIRDKFERSHVFTESSSKRAELQALVEEMVEDSRGVFIWVFLVVESLLRGLSNEDRLVELRRRLNETPKTLNDLFERMLNSVEVIYQEQAAQILAVALQAVEPLFVIVYSFIGDDAHDALTSEVRPWTVEECISASKTAELRISVRCPDLIKIRKGKGYPTTTQSMVRHQLDFLHRTVRDFLTLEDTQRRLHRRLQKPFDPVEFTCHGLLSQVKGAAASDDGFWSNDGPRKEHWELLETMCHYVGVLEQRTGKPQLELLDELERVIAQQVGTRDFVISGESFLGVMVRKNLYLYVEAKLPQGLPRHGVPLLECALWPEGHFQDGQPLPRMVSLLLDHAGARPADMGGDGAKSIWYGYLYGLYKLRQQSGSPLSQAAREAHAAVMASLLRHGADTRVRCAVGRTEPRPAVGRAKGIRYLVYKDVLEILQEVFQPEDRAYLEAIVQERRLRFWSDWTAPDWLRFKFLSTT
ncbi:hypothetical protein ARSEF1564_006062 [Beauveria bassiana]